MNTPSKDQIAREAAADLRDRIFKERSVEYIGKHIDVEHFGAASSEGLYRLVPAQVSPNDLRAYELHSEDPCGYMTPASNAAGSECPTCGMSPCGLGAASSEPPELIVTKDGVPFEDQAEGIRQFKAASLRSEPPKEERGEWTPQSVKSTIGVALSDASPSDAFDACKRLADAHNAELKAEREKRKPLVDALTKLRAECTPPTDKRELVEWTGLIFSSAVKEICEAALAGVKEGE